MATIEERAKEYAKGRRYTLTSYEGYIAGADEWNKRFYSNSKSGMGGIVWNSKIIQPKS